MSDKNIHLYQLSYLETFNKYLLTFSTSSIPVLWLFIKENKGWIIGFKIISTPMKRISYVIKPTLLAYIN